MSVCFRCPDCRNTHHSRLRAPDGQWLATAMHAFGTIQELCPVTQRWVRVGAEELSWALDAEPTPLSVSRRPLRPVAMGLAAEMVL